MSVTGAIAAAAGAAVLYAYGALAQALSVPMRAGELGASHAQAITPASFASGVVFCTVAGTILAMILAARAAEPARAFVRTTVILVAVSLVFPLAASHTATTTRLTLALGLADMHRGCQRRRMSRRCCTGHRRSNSVGSSWSSARRCSIKVTYPSRSRVLSRVSRSAASPATGAIGATSRS